jgi:Protein of unknown function (DUF1822)
MLSTLIDSTDHVLQIAPEQQALIWQRSRSQPTHWARWNAYLNELCLENCLDWLKSEHLPGAKAFPETALWSLINGSVLIVDNIRIALILTEAIDRSELEVQQEWIDIPSFAADYYLGIQIAIDCRSITIYGYTTHQQLKSEGIYNAQERTYCLNIDDLNPDLNALWLSYLRYSTSQTRSLIDTIPPLDVFQAEQLIESLNNPDKIMPRLELPFQIWAALLDNPKWQNELCQQRSGKVSTSIFTKLNLWFQGQFNEVWQSVDQVLLPQQIMTSIRSSTIQTSSENNLAAICRAKILELNDGQIAIVLRILPVSTTENQINLQVHPVGGAVCLPGEIQLRLLSNDNEIGNVTATVSETIQLQFLANVGEQFGVEIICNKQLLKEQFSL